MLAPPNQYCSSLNSFVVMDTTASLMTLMFSPRCSFRDMINDTAGSTKPPMMKRIATIVSAICPPTKQICTHQLHNNSLLLTTMRLNIMILIPDEDLPPIATVLPPNDSKEFPKHALRITRMQIQTAQ